MKLFWLCCLAGAAVLSETVSAGGGLSRQEEYDPFNGLLWLHTYPLDDSDRGKEHKWMWVQTERTYVKFSLKACHSAHIGMATHPGDPESLHYEVVFGQDFYGLKDLRTGVYLAQNNTAVLDCDNHKDIWISWGNRSIEVGLGSVVPDGLLLSHVTPDAFSTRAVSFTTGEMQHGFWRLHKDMGRLITVHNLPPAVENTPDYNYLWLSFEEEPFVVVQVMMCSDARINTSPNRQDPTGSIEIRIGTEGNTKTSVHHYDNQHLITEVDTTGILSCNEYRYFWFARQNGFMELGQGSRIGDNRILYYQTGPQVINLGFATTDPNGGSWQFRHITGEFYSIWTHYDNHQWDEVMITTTHTYMELYIQSCMGAIVVLNTANTTLHNNEYFLTIGDSNNQQTTLKQRNPDGDILWKIAETPSVLHCDVAKPFWVSWTDSAIYFAPGFYNINESVLEWTSPSEAISPMRALFLSSANNQPSTAEWRVNIHSVSTLTRRTNGLASYNQLWYDVTDTSQFVFEVRVCSDAFVKLTEFHRVTDYHSYEFQLGVLGDKKVLLLKDDNTVQSVTMGKPLQCTFPTQYWIAWKKQPNNSTVISFGNGPYIYEDPVVEYIDTNGYDINAVSIATGELKMGDWIFSAVEDNSLVLVTDPVYGYHYGFVAVSHYWFTFSIRACSHTCFLVSGNTDYNNFANSRTVEFCLGVAGNTKSHINDLEVEGVSLVDTPNILSCQAYRKFWFTWDHQYITVGQGDLFNNPTLTYTGPEANTVSIRFVQFSSTDMFSATIKVPKESYGLINLQTKGNNVVPVNSPRKPSDPALFDVLYGRYWITSISKAHIIFSVMACQEVHVALSPQYGGQHYIQVRIGVSNNTVTEISHLDIVRSSTSEGILSCNEKRDFWITWSIEEVAVGTGWIPGDNRIVNHRESMANYAVHALSFATSKNYVGSWEIPSHDVDNYLARTSADQDQPVSVLTRQSQFFFTLMVASNAEIILEKSDSDYFRIELGGDDGKSLKLFKRDSEMKSEANRQYVAEGVTQKFWLTWKSNTLNLLLEKQKLGIGHTIGKQTLLMYVDGGGDVFLNEVVKLKLSSTKCPTHGYWAFSKHQGNATIYNTPQNGGYYGLRVMTRAVTETVFRVKTCNQALIALSDIPGVISERTLEIVIEDGMTALRNGTGGEVLVSFTTKGGNLDCQHFRAYWIRWKNYIIELGAGNSVGNSRFMVYYLSDHSYTVNELAVGTGESEGLWEFSPLAGNLYHVHTQTVYDVNMLHSQMWLSHSKTYIQFAVKTNKHARIALSKQPMKHRNNTYEVIIGDNNNQDTVLYYMPDAGGVKENTRVSTPGVLDGNNYRTFWISWENQAIRVGAGQLYSGQLLTMQGTMFNPVYALSFASWNETYADWSFLQGDDDALMVQSREYYHGSDFSMTVTHRTHMVFQVKSCHNAVILLASEFGNEQGPAYEIGIGTNSNQMSHIKATPGGAAEAETPNILDCEQYKTFWVSWKDARVRFGHGSYLDVDEVISWDDPEDPARDVVQAFLNTGNQDIGLWQLIDLDGESFTIHTGTAHSYDFVEFVPVHHHITFKVQACSDAHIALITGSGGEARVHYEVVIGCCGNMKTVIRNESLTYNVARQDTPLILDCTQLRTFWVSWQNGLVQVGVGEAYTHVLVEYQDPTTFQVDKVSLSTWDGVEGKFKLAENIASDISMLSRDVGAYSYSQFWRTLMGQDYFVFRVQAPSNVQLLLSVAPNIVETNAYEVKIGTEGNKKTEIVKKGGNPVVVETDGILSESEMRDFWIQWSGTHIRLGTGMTVGENEKISVEDSEFNINAFSITTATGVTASWVFPQDYVVASTTIGTNSPPTGSNPPGGTTTTVGTTQLQPDPPGEGLSAGAIVGITFGVIGFVMILALGVILFIRLRQLKNYNEFVDEDDTTESTPGMTWDNPNYDNVRDIPLNDQDNPFQTGYSST